MTRLTLFALVFGLVSGAAHAHTLMTVPSAVIPATGSGALVPAAGNVVDQYGVGGSKARSVQSSTKYLLEKPHWIVRDNVIDRCGVGGSKCRGR